MCCVHSEDKDLFIKDYEQITLDCWPVAISWRETMEKTILSHCPDKDFVFADGGGHLMECLLEVICGLH